MDAFCYDRSKNQSKVVLKGEWSFYEECICIYGNIKGMVGGNVAYLVVSGLVCC